MNEKAPRIRKKRDTRAGSGIFKGVLDIFGTTNRLIIVYPLLGAFMLAAAALTEAAIKNGLVETDQA